MSQAWDDKEKILRPRWETKPWPSAYRLDAVTKLSYWETGDDLVHLLGLYVKKACFLLGLVMLKVFCVMTLLATLWFCYEASNIKQQINEI